MKRIFVIALLSSILSINSFAQCTPDTSIHQPGVFPDSATGFTPGYLGMPYNQVIQLKVPQDTVVIIFGQPITIPIDSVQLTSFSGLPTGLALYCNPSSCTYPGGSNGCAVISGTPTDTGHFQLTATVTTYAGGGLPPQVNTVNYYSITVTDPAGLEEFTSNNFAVTQNTPNPFSGISIITYNIPHNGKVEFKMYNLLGKEVYHYTEQGKGGINNISIEGSKFSPGTYMYSLMFDNKTITKSLMISEQ